MRRKSKPRVVWLPPTNAFSIDSGSTSTWCFASAPLSGGGADANTVIEVPIVMDGAASDPLSPTTTLADIESSGYRLRRIVGKIYCFISQTTDGGATPAEAIYGVSAGLIIRRSDPATGTSLAATVASDVDPAKVRNSMDPWIWRRSWLLSNGPDMSFFNTGGDVSASLASKIANGGPGANYGRLYPGGNVEGPHVDQKTARIVGQEERLFLDVSATTIIANGDVPSLIIVYEMRVLASMRTNLGNRRNASR